MLLLRTLKSLFTVSSGTVRVEWCMQHFSKHTQNSFYKAWIRGKNCQDRSFCAQTETLKRLLLLLSWWCVMFTASWRVFLIYLLSLLHANNNLQILVTSRYFMSDYDSIVLLHHWFSLSPCFLIFFSWK